ncbi:MULTISPECIES: peptidase T [unclassified Vibrio]|uniref:peptidase T n=2 Tax=Vibrio TaxID=662 RepID=UPI001372B309|nr:MULTISPECIES: peptidase T [unclassified Vibrio]NAW69473.1 peptidase T [Vibrio sp. V28_P6S34P95]NAX06423.1 peptidase T [Vibrio sp. V30_P3S12P165]NAX36220.1 peptidase T [Vibrio sp. V27_P1S3P104]NAX39101.1 peptidase T [Vibrio sp. V26_P1S5P106]NNN44908.1 peptidase T [Vibrio sp. 1-1(7)]
MNNLVERFLRYVTYDTQSKPKNTHCPSSTGQRVFGQLLYDELRALGLNEVSLDDHGYVMAKLKSNVDYPVPAIGFISHMDTAPDASGKHVKPQIVENYQGGDIALGKGDEILSPIQYPELHQLHGYNLITTDGNTLLGADNKAGIAEIITAVELLIADPSIPHGDICLAFTPDEEIGRGADHFDVEKFAAQWAYTIDGGPVGELEFENFHAANAQVVCHGVNVHPGTAKDKMVNSMYLAAQFIQMMPAQETPEHTEGYQGFYHLKSAKMSVARSQLDYLIRDFDLAGFADRKALMQQKVAELNRQLNKGHIELDIIDSYANMKEKIAEHPHIIELAKSAMQACGIEPMIKPIRGGTDGARLSFMGLPCPNIFTGGYNFHGIHEFITIEGMEQAVRVIMKLAEKTARQYAL